MNSPRRVWLPWLLLLVPTLLIGAVALRLLWLEQRRIDEAGTEAAARAAAVTRERAQVAADNIELLVAEIRDGLMRELAETPAANLEALLANWPHTNPLVAQTFLWKPNGGGLTWPPADTAEHRQFRTRHAELFRGGVARLAAQSESDGRAQPMPVSAGTSPTAAAEPMVAFVAPVPKPVATEPQTDEVREGSSPATGDALVAEAAREKEQSLPPAREPIVIQFAADAPDAPAGFTANTQVVQNRALRRDVQQQAKASAELARNYAPASAKKERGYASSSYAPSSAAQSPVPASKFAVAPGSQPQERKAAEESATAKGQADNERGVQPTADAAAGRARTLMETAERQETVPSKEAAPAVVSPKLDDAGVPAAAATPPSPSVAATESAPTAEGLEPSRAPWGAPASGWLVREDGGARYFLGWWQPAGGGAVRGVELNLAAVLERVQALVPGPSAEGARFAVRGPGEPLAGAAISIPLSTTLPGWSLVAWPGAPAKIESLDVGGGFFVVAALLVGVFVVSIVAGGVLFFRQAEAAAREAALKTSFVSNVSHEMKTPLTTIRMYAEMLADDRIDDAAKRARYFATIGRETARLTRLVNNALDFSRLEAGRKEYRPESIALGPWLARLVETYAPRAMETGVRLVATPPANGAAVRCDPDTLDQMALNLIDNGLKYGRTGAILELHVDAVAAGWAIVVADRGPGVPAAHRERIFDRFHRVDDALTATQQGAGLGLTIARRLARDQGGDLVCHGREGGGAAFVLTLPAASDDAAPQKEAP